MDSEAGSISVSIFWIRFMGFFNNKLFAIQMPFLILLGSYVFISTIFYKFPILKTKKNCKSFKKHEKDVLVISHRGGAGENVENTIEAFD